MKEVLKAILFVVGLYVVGVLFLITISYFLPVAIGIILIWAVVKLIKNSKNG